MKDHETHNVCNERLAREGGSATCCDCNPHDDCTLGQSSERVTDVGKTIKPITGTGTVISELQAKINEIIKYINEKPTQKTNI